MKDKEKIEILIRDNKALIDKLDKLEQTTDKEQTKQYFKLLEEQKQITEDLNKCLEESMKIKKENEKIKYKYHKMFRGLRIRKLFGK